MVNVKNKEIPRRDGWIVIKLILKTFHKYHLTDNIQTMI